MTWKNYVLAPREALVLIEQFGLIDGQKKPLKTIAEELGRSTTTVQQISTKAVQSIAIRHYYHSKTGILQDFLHK